MKTAIACPNKNDPAWKKLVAEIGEERSYIAFFRNGDVIPDAATARWILKIRPEAEQKPSPPATPVETRIPAIQFRRADAHTIKGGQITTPRSGRLLAHGESAMK